MRVLVVEDIPRHANRIAEGLRDQGIAVDVAYDGHEAITKLSLTAYDVVLLDRDLPGIHGGQICQLMTHTDNPPMILMLTAAGALTDRVTGLALGADDYLPKPFHFPGLVLRARRPQANRPAARPPSRRNRTRPADQHRHPPRTNDQAHREGTSRTRSPPHWDENADSFTNTVKVTIARLRRKLGQPDVIHTTPGIGYRITETP